MTKQYAVIFDMDGVLADSYAAHFQSWTQMFREVGVEFDEQQFRGTFGRTNRDIFTELFGRELTAPRAAELADRKEQLYREIIRKEFPAMPGATQLIDQLFEAGYLLAVGSSGPPENVELSLQLLDRRQSFHAMVTGADVQRGKPDPQVFLLAAEALHAEPHRCIVVEDAPQGIEAARNAAMLAVALVGTADKAALSQADLIVDSLSELNPSRLSALLDGRTR